MSPSVAREFKKLYEELAAIRAELEQLKATKPERKNAKTK